MSDPFDAAIDQSASWAEGGEPMDLVVGEDGLTTYGMPEPEMPVEQDQSTLPASMTRRQRRGQEPTITPMEGLERFGETMAGASVGLVPGMVAGSVGAVPDLGGLIYGALKAAGAEEGDRLQAFSEGFGNIITENVGSENLLNVFGQLVDILPVSEDVKEGMRAGAEAGSFVGIGGTATAGGKAISEGARRYAAGAPARVAERGTDMAPKSDIDPTIAINVRVDKKSNLDYADLIISGDKKFETRDSDSLRPYVGKRIGVARTGAGKAKAIGSVEIGEPIIVDEVEFRKLQDQHLVPEGSSFDIKPGGKKYLYPVSNPERFDSPKEVGKGIVARKILGGGDQ